MMAVKISDKLIQTRISFGWANSIKTQLGLKIYPPTEEFLTLNNF